METIENVMLGAGWDDIQRWNQVRLCRFVNQIRMIRVGPVDTLLGIDQLLRK